MELLIYKFIRVPVISVRYSYLIKDVLCNFVWFTTKYQMYTYCTVKFTKPLAKRLEKPLLLHFLLLHSNIINLKPFPRWANSNVICKKNNLERGQNLGQ